MNDLRPFDPEADYRWMTEWWNAENSDERRAEDEFHREDSLRDPKYTFERWTFPSRWIGSFGHNSWAHRDDRYVVDIFMTQDADLAEYKSAVEWGIGKTIAADGKELMMWARSDRPRSGVFEDLGFTVVESVPVTRLELADFDGASISTRRAELEAEGIRFCTVADLEAEGTEWMPPLYESSWEIVQDIPSAYAPTQMPYEKFVQRFSASTEHDPELMWLAMEGDRIVGYSRLYPSKVDPEFWRTGMSGVVRSHRRRGIVTVLKVIGASTAKARGARRIQTENNDINPMLNVNLRMGYRESYRALMMEKKL